MKRRLLIIAVCLLLGAVVNVAVAWGFAYWRPHHGEGSEIALTSGDAENVILARFGVPDGWDEYRFFGSGYQSLGLTTTCWEAWPKPNSRDPLFQVLALQRGMPARALSSEFRAVDGKGSFRTALVLPPAVGSSRHILDLIPMLPLKPIWPGIAVNTLFYAAILWLLIAGLSALRRLLRLRRGLCPKCAYPMGESPVCTECGGALASRIRVT